MPNDGVSDVIAHGLRAFDHLSSVEDEPSRTRGPTEYLRVLNAQIADKLVA